METGNKKYLNKEANREYYSESDGHFMSLAQSRVSHQVIDRLRWARDWVHKLESDYHLDIGCKDGYLTLTLTEEGIDCVGVDPSEDAIEAAEQKATQAGQDIWYINSFVEDLELDSEFDTVTCLEVLEHVVDPSEVLHKLKKLGRYLLISTPDANGTHGLEDAKRNEEHVRVYTQEELEKFLKQFGDIIESVVRDNQICILLDTYEN